MPPNLQSSLCEGVCVCACASVRAHTHRTCISAAFRPPCLPPPAGMADREPGALEADQEGRGVPVQQSLQAAPPGPAGGLGLAPQRQDGCLELHGHPPRRARPHLRQPGLCQPRAAVPQMLRPGLCCQHGWPDLKALALGAPWHLPCGSQRCRRAAGRCLPGVSSGEEAGAGREAPLGAWERAGGRAVGPPALMEGLRGGSQRDQMWGRSPKTLLC